MNESSDPPPSAFNGPIKHSVTIAGHRTSISLEPVFWAALRRAAEEEGVTLHALVARIDEARIASLASAGRGRDPHSTHPANLASAIRIWLWQRYCK
ncbi:MAG: ribbon-helix-helix domain-containing protein [Sphingobium sp.]|nr:ribbon-helix-helix domain-containing protein [Sphingobium sp.]MCI1270954.1 ribbon-helix-helix domain-containing protein [Sphingobium sp.]MCI1757015.1 ribbon-helix-helix domain-containing protein [Sphingobium sp.]MCI2052512.1 ribbon-helix-helix domain-containing protein [Sphingobium sp.]